MNKREIDFYYPRLIIMYGEYCILCGKTCNELKIDKLEIHEIIHERPLKIQNMRMMCHGCNNLKELNKANLELSAEPDPSIYQVSKRVYPIFKDWIAGEMMANLKDGLELQTLIADACLYTGMKRQTIINWVRPLYQGKTSPYIEWGGILFLKGREPKKLIEKLPVRTNEYSDTDQEELK